LNFDIHQTQLLTAIIISSQL